MRPIRLASLALLLGLLMMIGRTEGAHAHALLVRSEPANDARLRERPVQVRAWFTEPVEPGVSVLRVLGGAGQRADVGTTEFSPSDPRLMSVPLRADLPPGFYTVTWETLSRIDGHIWFGSYDFTLLNPDGSSPDGARPSTGTSQPGASTNLAESAVTKAVQLFGAALLVGGLAFLLLVAQPAAHARSEAARTRTREAAGDTLVRMTWLALALLAASGIADLLLQARQLGGVGAFGTILGLTWGQRWLERQAVLVAVAVVVLVYSRRRVHRGRVVPPSLWAAMVGGLGYLLLLSASSHAAAITAGSFWATASDFIHLAAASIWVGGLAAFALLIRWSGRNLSGPERPRLLAAALQRFSLLAASSVTVLLASGVFNALVEVPNISSLFDTAYGRALSAKLLLALPLLGVAAYNAFALRPRVVRAAGDTGRAEALRQQLSRLVRLEATLAAGVLAVVAVLVWYPPARSLAAGGSGEPVTVGDRFTSPLVAGAWWVVALLGAVTAASLMWIWSVHQTGLAAPLKRGLRTAALALPAVAAVVLLIALALRPSSSGERNASPSPPAATTSAAVGRSPTSVPPDSSSAAGGSAAITLRYQTAGGLFMLLEVTPLQVGANQARVTLLDGSGTAIPARAVTLESSRLEAESPATNVPVTATSGLAWVGDLTLTETGWWALHLSADGEEVVFYLRLDAPSRAPLAFAPADYPSNPSAEAAFRRALDQYEQLSAVRWREELTSGLSGPAGIGAWVLTNGEAEAPDRVHLRVLSPGHSNYELYRIGRRSCTLDAGKPWQCSTGESEKPLDLDYLTPSTAFRFGRRELVDGDPTRVVLFYNPTQPAWYAWWISEATGDLRRQAMVAPGHFMLLRLAGQNIPIGIALPPQGQ